jgi:hypothetical protein
LTGDLGLDGAGFNFPTNGSGSPDSQASARTTATLLSVLEVFNDEADILGIVHARC